VLDCHHGTPNCLYDGLLQWAAWLETAIRLQCAAEFRKRCRRRSRWSHETCFQKGTDAAMTILFDEPAGESRKSVESAGKPRLDLLPTVALEQIGAVLTFGASKYGDNNWRRGARWGRYYAALLRHLYAWWRGEDCDPETGLSHLAHAACCLLFLMEYQRNDWGTDDRFSESDGELFTKDDGIV
jgi:hypothetical protein